jgi:acyl-CoA thioester hydrolase
MKTISTPVQIRFNDIDMFGHVNNSVYNQYLDCGKVEYMLRVLGQSVLFGKRSMVIVRIENDFLNPVLPTDELLVITGVEAVGEKSVTLRQSVVDKKGEVKVESRSILSTYDTEEKSSFPMPDEWLKALDKFNNS